MAVPVQKIKDRLKALFPKANLSTQRLDALAAKLANKPADDADDTAIDAVINDANDFMSFEDIAKEDDRIRTLEAKAKAPAPNPNPNNPTPAADPAPADVPDWAKGIIETTKSMAESNKTLLEKVSALESGKIIDAKRQTAKQLFDGSDVLKGMKAEIKESWLKRVDVNSETPLEDQIKGLETEYSEITQIVADNRQSSGPPAMGDPNTKPDDKLIDNIVDSM